MGKSLVIVESPAKAKTISKFLGKDYRVEACVGHVRALPSKDGSVDIVDVIGIPYKDIAVFIGIPDKDIADLSDEDIAARILDFVADNAYIARPYKEEADFLAAHIADFIPAHIADDVVPKYDIITRSKKYLKGINKSLKGCDTVYLATDLDREGEAIAWHLVSALKLDKETSKGPKYNVKRITFHEITKEAINESLRKPGDIAVDLVDAQQARVVLDYLVGFNLSPFLWKKIRYGLSAGRVQSVALRIICERETEIKAFVTDEYWTVKARLTPKDMESPFEAQLIQIKDEKLDKLAIKNEEQANEIVSQLEAAEYIVSKIKKREVKRTPPPPFITSTLQQEASRKLGFSARRTMSTAQKLYEGIDVGKGTMGLITYMRTDSVHLAISAVSEIHAVITKEYGEDYALKTPRVFSSKSKNVQEAHEAIRPTDSTLIPDEIKSSLTQDQYKLYNLIWKRAVASQMARAVLDSVSIDIKAKDDYTFRVTGSTIRFPGFMKLYIEGKDDNGDEKEAGMLPLLEEKQVLDLLKLLPEQHFTQPPPRYTEASLIKTLEEYGIGRPSTYASIINVLQDREYVKLVKKRFFPEDVGMVVNDLLVKHFSKYVDYTFTSYLEDRLDVISRGEAEWKPAINEFWIPFKNLIEFKIKTVGRYKGRPEQPLACPECKKPLVIKLGKYGRFYACSGFPDCKFVRSLELSNGEDGQENPVIDEKCEKCGNELVMRQGKYGSFYGCSKYPDCKFIRPLNKPVSLGINCPDCSDGEVMEKKSRRGKIFFSCSNYPKCKFASWDKPVNEPCPECGYPILVDNTTKRFGHLIKCPVKSCKYKRDAD